MKTICIELSSKNHACMFDSWNDICSENDWIFTTISLKEMSSNISVEVKESRNSFLELSIFNTISLVKIVKFILNTKPDRVVFLSIQANFFLHLIIIIFMRIANINVGVSIHNANTWFFSSLFSELSLKTIGKKLFREIYKKLAFCFFVNSNNMLNFISSKADELGKGEVKNVIVVPFSTRKGTAARLNEKLCVVYPGMVSIYRKRYDTFIRLAENHPQIRFIALGAPDKESKNSELFKRMKAMINIDTFENYIDQNEFRKIMSNSSVIFSDIQVSFSKDGYVEEYGASKDSGVSYLMMEFEKPGFLNRDFNNLSHLVKNTAYYEHSSIEKDFTMFLENIRDYSKFSSFSIADTAKQLIEKF